MYTLDDILLLGDPRLRQVCAPVWEEELASLRTHVIGMADLILQFRAHYGAGRAIAAPQVGIMKRFVVMNIETPRVFYNPQFVEGSSEMMELWDDCMSFPDLLVRLKRHRKITIQYRDEQWTQRSLQLQDDLAELLQHECDHLDGILAIERAIDEHALKWRRS